MTQDEASVIGERRWVMVRESLRHARLPWWPIATILVAVLGLVSPFQEGLAGLIILMFLVSGVRLWWWWKRHSDKLPVVGRGLKYSWFVAPKVAVMHSALALNILLTWADVMARIGGTARVRGSARDQVPKLTAVESLPRGLGVRFRIPPGIEPERFFTTSAYAAAWGVDEVKAEMIDPSIVQLTAITAPDELSEVALYRDYAATGTASVEQVPVGIDETGELVSLGMLESNVLLAGIPGSGKSGAMTAIMCGLGQVENVGLIGLDPKKVELSSWRDRFSVIATELDHMTQVLENVAEEMERRYEYLAETGKKKLARADVSPERPVLVVVVDELAEVVAAGEDKSADTKRATLLRRLVAKGRAAGVVVVVATQKPSSDVIPTSFRDLVAQRIAFETTNRQMTETILGSGLAENGPAHAISGKGVGYLLNESNKNPQKMRALWVPDDSVAEYAANVADKQVTLEWLS